MGKLIRDDSRQGINFQKVRFLLIESIFRLLYYDTKVCMIFILYIITECTIGNL